VPSSATEELERALAASFDHTTLAVYADHLQAEGDPRGELIALDLEIAQRGGNAALVGRRTELVHAWLGALTAHDALTRAVRFGFFEDLELAGRDALATLSALLASPHGRYLRGLELRDHHPYLEHALAALATVRNDWLATLSLRGWGSQQRLDDAIAERLIDATPALAKLVVEGEILGELPHPHLTELAVIGARSFTGIFRTGPALPAVRSLSFAFAQHELADDEMVVDLDTLIAQPRLPALVALDLSRNESPDPDDPGMLIGGRSIFAYLGTLELRHQLTHLVLPALRDDGDTAELLDVLASMPKLQHVQLARNYRYEVPPLYHATAEITFTTVWPWRRDARAGEQLRVTIPGARSPELVELATGIAAIRQTWTQLPHDARAAWNAVGAAIDDADGVPLDMLLLALQACGELLDVGGWRELREALIDHRVAGARVTLSRVIP